MNNSLDALHNGQHEVRLQTSSYQSSSYPPGPQGQRQATVALFLHGSSQGFNENLWGFAHINGLTRAAVVMIVAYSGRGCWTRARPQNSSKNIGHILQYSRGSGCLLAGWGTNHCYCCCWWWYDDDDGGGGGDENDDDDDCMSMRFMSGWSPF